MIADAIDKYLALDYTNIKTKKTSPPTNVPAAQLPMMFARSVELNRNGVSLDFSGAYTDMDMELVVLVEPVRQNTQEKNYALVRSIMEDLAIKFEANSRNLLLMNYRIVEGFEQLNADTAHYAVVAQIRCGL